MVLPLFVRLGVRDLHRHQRRNLMLGLSIAVAVFGTALFAALIGGLQTSMMDSLLSKLNGHVKVLAPGYLDDPSIDHSFELRPAWQSDIPDAQLSGWARRIRVPAVIMSEREVRGVELVGIDPANENISFLGKATFAGEHLTDGDDKRVIVGQALLDKLRSGVGKRLVLITQGADGRSRERGFRIAGAYSTESEALERTYVFTGVTFLQQMLGAPNVTELSIRLKDPLYTFDLKQALINFFSGLDVRDWTELDPLFGTIILIYDFAGIFLYVILVGGLAFGLVNSLLASVFERIKEFGMLRAIGMRPSLIIAQIVFQSMLLMVAGSAVGICAALLLNAWLGGSIDLSAIAEAGGMLGVYGELVLEMGWSGISEVIAMSLTFGFIASVYPAWRAVRIKPLEALRR